MIPGDYTEKKKTSSNSTLNIPTSERGTDIVILRVLTGARNLVFGNCTNTSTTQAKNDGIIIILYFTAGFERSSHENANNLIFFKKLSHIFGQMEKKITFSCQNVKIKRVEVG